VRVRVYVCSLASVCPAMKRSRSTAPVDRVYPVTLQEVHFGCSPWLPPLPLLHLLGHFFALPCRSVISASYCSIAAAPFWLPLCCGCYAVAAVLWEGRVSVRVGWGGH